jgi:hypothetical protein
MGEADEQLALSATQVEHAARIGGKELAYHGVKPLFMQASGGSGT